MVVFYSYVSLPEGRYIAMPDLLKRNRLAIAKVIKHGWLENPTFVDDFRSYKPSL